MSTSLKLTIDAVSTKREVHHLKSYHTRVLVGVPINILHSLTQIEKTHEQKIAGHILKIEYSTLGPQDMMFGYQRYWWPSLKFDTLVISFKTGVKFVI